MIFASIRKISKKKRNRIKNNKQCSTSEDFGNLSTYSNKFPKKGVVKAEKEEDTFFQVKT
jgi:hypothetical protein